MNNTNQMSREQIIAKAIQMHEQSAKQNGRSASYNSAKLSEIVDAGLVDGEWIQMGPTVRFLACLGGHVFAEWLIDGKWQEKLIPNEKQSIAAGTALAAKAFVGSIAGSSIVI